MARNSRGAGIRLLNRVPILFVGLTRFLPLSWSRALGKWAGRAAYCLVPRIRKVGLANLDLAYGDTLTPGEKRRIVRGSAENLGIVAGEFAHAARLLGPDYRQYARFEGAEHVVPGQGAVYIGAHLGNWEWMPALMHQIGNPLAVVYRPLDDPALDAAIARNRVRGGAIPIPKSDAGRSLIRRVKEGLSVGILIDQSPRDNAMPVTFFGQPTWATIAPVLVAARARVPIHPAWLTRDSRGYCFHIGPSIELAKSGDPRADLKENTQRCQNAIEAMIREYPEQWLWFHRRWKPRPRLEAEWQEKQARRGKG